MIGRLEEVRQQYILFGPPPLRLLAEASADSTVHCELTGTVLSVRVSGEKAVLTVRAGKDAGKVWVSLENAGILPVPGSRIHLTGKAELFDPALNPGGFSYRDYYDSIGIWLKFRADTCEALSDGSPVLKWIYRFRQTLSDSVESYADPEDAGILKSLLLSDTSEQTKEERDAFSFLGLLQIISLSGLQLVFIGDLIFGCIRKKTGRKIPAFFAGLFIVFLLSVFTGFSMSAVRALIIYCMRAGAVFLKRHFDFASAGALALILLLLEAPLRIYTSGFHFMAGILIAVGIANDLLLRFLRIRGGIFRGLFTALSVQTCLLPVRLYHSFCWSFLSPFLYALLFPVSGMLFILGALGAAVGLVFHPAARFLFGAEHYFVKFLRKLTDLGNQAYGLTVITGRPSLVRILIYVLICILFLVILRILLNRRKKVTEDEEMHISSGIRIGTAVAFLSVILFGLLFLHASPLKKHTSEILMMDCGQGDAFLIRTADGTVILSDAGSSSDDSFYREQLAKTLLYYGIRNIDYVIVSHPDQDHISGLTELLSERRFHVRYILYSEILADDPMFQEFFEQTEHAGAVKLSAGAGKELAIPGGRLCFLWPNSDSIERGNEASLVFLLEYHGHKALFTGDISSEEERKLLPLTDIDILKVAHHGSRFSSSLDFLTAVSPELALISCSKYNSYGHPAKETLERLKAAGAEVYTTQHKGAVSVFLYPDRILVKPLQACYDNKD